VREKSLHLKHNSIFKVVHNEHKSHIKPD